MPKDITTQIQDISAYPISHQVLMSLLEGYANPNDKVYELVRKRILQPVKRGLYIAGPEIRGARPENMLLANHISGPSYVTAESALAWRGMIPERVYTTVSATTKRGGMISTGVGVFSYHHLPLPWYSFGIRSVKLASDQYAMVASPEKALFDKIIFTPRLRIRNRKQAIEMLLENMRMDEDALKQLQVKEARSWLNDAPKSDSIKHIIEAIQSL